MSSSNSPAEHNRRLKEMLNEMSSADSKVGRFKGMIYGAKGSGKTVFAVRFMRAICDQQKPGQRIIYVDTSEGWVSLKNHKGVSENVEVIRFRDYDYLKTLLLAIERNMSGFENVGGIIFDEATKMANRDIQREFEKRGKSEAPEWPDYFKGSSNIQQLLTFIYEKTPNINFMMVGHEKDKKNDQGVVIKTFPSFTPAIGEEVLGDLHLVARMTNKIDRQNMTFNQELQVHPSVTVEAKSRVSPLPFKVAPAQLVKVTLDWLASGGEANTPIEEADSLAATELPDVPKVQQEEEDEDTPVFASAE